MKKSISILCFLFGFSFNVQAAELLPAPQKVSDHVYAWIGPYHGPSKDNNGYRMNMGFVVGTKSVMVFETSYYPKMAESMISHIKKNNLLTG